MSTASEIKERLKNKYDYLTDSEVEDLYLMSVSDYLMIRYPSTNNRPDIADLTLDFSTSNWIYKRMLDILGRAGGTSLTAYKENDLSLTYGASYIDPELYSEIMPQAGVPK